MSFENRRKVWGAHVVSTTRSSTTWNMDKGFWKNALLHMTISMETDAIECSPKWMGVLYFLVAICGLKLKRSR
jgi:hypothetical protein